MKEKTARQDVVPESPRPEDAWRPQDDRRFLDAVWYTNGAPQT